MSGWGYATAHKEMMARRLSLRKWEQTAAELHGRVDREGGRRLARQLQRGTLGWMSLALGIAVAVTLVFFLGRWRGRVELLGDVPMKTQIVVSGRLDDGGNMRVAVTFTARTAVGLTITGEKDMLVPREDWLAAFPRGP